MRGTEVVAFAGIAYPGKFFAFLEAEGARIVLSRAFPDHQPYDEGMLAPLVEEAGRRKLRLVTTEKDLVRVPVPLRPKITALGVGIAWQDQASLDRLLDRVVAGGHLRG